MHTDPHTRLKRPFFLNPDVVGMARSLLGAWLCTDFGEGITIGRIVETEAYRGPDDKACHAYAHKLTPRTAPMYLQGGHAYIYLCYGIHHLFNVVTGPEGAAHAVLIRAIEPVQGLTLMQQRRGRTTPVIGAGPGACGAALGMQSTFTGTDLCAGESKIWIARGTGVHPEEQIRQSTRIGVAYAQECAAWGWRFYLHPNRHVSKVLRTDLPFALH